MSKGSKSFFLKFLLWLVFILLILAGIIAYFSYQTIYEPNINTGDKKSEIIYIPTGSNFEDVVRILSNANLLKHKASFIRMAKIKKYQNNIRAGKYRILANINNNELVNLLRAGIQEPVSITFNNIRKKEQIISIVCKKLEADSTELSALLNNDLYLKEKFGVTSDQVLALFIPNTYKFQWNTSAKQFMNRIKYEYKVFWNPKRKAAAHRLGLTPIQVSILASIVQAEQLQFADERPIIAGLYLNRLKIGMPLQSDPTVIFAIGDYTITRVLNKDKEVNSPYNTYIHTGLPPGPIYLPDISSIDAVLNPVKSDYLYMCAKEDLSGKHNFAKSLTEHNINAQRYRAALNRLKIMH